MEADLPKDKISELTFQWGFASSWEDKVAVTNDLCALHKAIISLFLVSCHRPHQILANCFEF